METKIEKFEFSALIGKRVTLMSVCDNIVKIANKVGDVLFLEAIEDPDDGYRSSLDYFRIIENSTGIFQNLNVQVVISGDERELIYFNDDSGHCWLTIGTDTSDSYYPCFTFDWTPPKIQLSNPMARKFFENID